MFTALYLAAVTWRINELDITISPFVFLLIGGAMVVAPMAYLRRWIFYRRRLKKNVITAEYEPPLDLNPAEIGYLFDGKLREREVAATLIHLIQRGLLNVKKTEHGKRIFAGPRVDSNLKSYENKLITVADVPNGVDVSTILSSFKAMKSKENGVESASMIIVFTHMVHSDLASRQYVKNNAIKAFLLSSFRIMVMLQLLFIVIPLVGVAVFMTLNRGTADLNELGTIAILIVVTVLFFAVPFYVASMLLCLLRGRIVGREWIITDKLERLWPQIVGYRQYVQLVENEKLEFQTEELKKIGKNDTLPYAVALGFVKNWRDLLS
jgi:Predicted membrane protein (DUF2207)